MKKNRIEICCGSYEDALAAWKGGAERIELNSALYLGGLTPSVGSLRLTKENTGLKVISMIRPRGAGFCYTETETEQMFADARILLENGSDGLAFGFLTSERKIDIEKTDHMIRLIHEFHGEAVFHRAFDCVENPIEAVEELIRLGTDRILTSGQKETAVQGAGLLKVLQEQYGKHIQILAGSGINGNNARKFMEETGIGQIHSSCRDWKTDRTTSGQWVNYCFAPEPHENEYDAVSERLVRKLTGSV